MPDRIIQLAMVAATIGERYSDLLRLLTASAATYNALHLSGVLSWAWRRFGRLCGWCTRVACWMRTGTWHA